MTIQVPLDSDKPLPKRIADALDEWYAVHGNPPPITESISIVVDGEVFEIKLFTVGEQA